MKILRGYCRCVVAGFFCLVVWTSYSQTNNITLTNNKGDVYTNVTVFRIEPDGVLFRFNDNRMGGGKIKFTNMPPMLQAQFGYDAQKAIAYETEQAAKNQRQAQWQAQQKQAALAAQLLAQQRAAQLAQAKQAAEQAQKEVLWQTQHEPAQAREGRRQAQDSSVETSSKQKDQEFEVPKAKSSQDYTSQQSGMVIGGSLGGSILPGSKGGMVIGGPLSGTHLPGSEGGMIIGGPLGGSVLPDSKGGMIIGGPLSGSVMPGSRGGMIIGGPLGGSVLP